MSIATQPRAPGATLIRPEIASPLAKLKRAIRTYVVSEGLAEGLAWACVWLWATFLIDWGMFALFGIDYIRDGSATARIVLRVLFTVTLWGGLAYFIGYKIVYRLLATFNEPALALVLERRFPDRLGDSLVTAVELADPKIGERYGYSQEMLDATTQDAAREVVGLPLAAVFNRNRLLARGLVAVVLLLAVGVFAVWATDPAAVWMERDLLLQDTYWPRRTILELSDFADTDTKAVPHGGEFKLNVRALKWVVATKQNKEWVVTTKQNKEGWRRLTWFETEPGFVEAVHSQDPSLSAWELYPPCENGRHILAIPTSWLGLSLDEMEARIDAMGAEVLTPDVQAHRSELGEWMIGYLRGRCAVKVQEGQSQLDDETLGYFPERYRLSGGIGTSTGVTYWAIQLQSDLLAATKRLTPPEIARLRNLLHREGFSSLDALQRLNGALSPFQPPFINVTQLQHDVVGTNALPITFTENDWKQLPILAQEVPADIVLNVLRDYSTSLSPDGFAEGMRLKLGALFAELDARAAQSHVGRRVRFRKLDVPAEVTVEFEQIQTDEERARSKAKRATPKVKRLPGTNDYVYEFKKIERPLRFRVVAGDDATPWYTIDVKPLPVLTSLVRQQDEPGYIHASNQRVQTGPFPVSVEGSDSKFDVPSGTRLRLEASASKPLQWVRVKAAGPTEHGPLARQFGHALTSPLGMNGVVGLMLSAAAENQNPLVQSLVHTEGASDFSFALRELAAEDLRLTLEFQDADGIIGRRLVNIGVLADKEPEFPRIGFEIVNRKMITNQAIIPFTGHIRDDHGLLELIYEVTVERADRSVVKQARFPLRRFSPLVTPEGGRAGLRFEKPGQVSFARLLCAPVGEWRVGDAWLAPLVLGRLPATGLGGLWQFPAADMPREYVFDYRPRPGSQPVLDISDEFFDSLELRTPRDQPILVDGRPLPLPYRVVVRILARDNRVRTGERGMAVADRQESQSPEAFDFTVVAEEDLLLEAGKREESIHDTAEEIIASLKKQQTLLKKSAAEFPSLQANEFRRVAADVQDVLKGVREDRTRVDVEVAREFRQVYRELVLNRCSELVLARIDQRICRPLELLLLPGQEFARTDEALDRLARVIEADRDKTPREVLVAAVDETDNLIRRLEDIVKEMKKLMEFNKALQALRELIKSQEDINRLIKEKFDKERARELGDKP